ncbi:DUF5518 domain-containing protein [Halococcus hamelinensis]|uniref:DUF5518 domain-containing protein n=1 Tax=Halococcus hamelinensis 100A6 TaxID=1132509 RepID=M0LW96_9EURY|nr:DUF5518 domain-containing protein [Halococcus hamelinensis]EMA37741.1 hypothetical protein C447_12235 [Halococcus hamelinensis 100A6]
MEIEWRTVAYGFGTALVLGLAAAYFFPYADMTSPILMYGLIGGAAGLVAGYYTTTGMGSAALNGGLSTTIGSVVVLGALVLLGLLFEGLVTTFGVAVAGLVLVVAYAIPGIVGGMVGEWYKEHRMERAAKPAAR